MPVALATLALAVFGHTVTQVLQTPQLSGAEAPITVRTASAILAGACLAGLTVTPDPIAEFRSVRNLRAGRFMIAAATLVLGTLAFGIDIGNGWQWESARSYLLIATAMILLARFGSPLTAATGFAAYLGACLFVGVTVDGRAQWWAVPVQPATGLTLGIALLAAGAGCAVLLAFRGPPLPADHRSTINLSNPRGWWRR